MGAQGRQLLPRARANPRLHRPQRRRQEHVAAHTVRPQQTDGGKHQARGPGQRPPGARRRAAPGNDRTRKHHDGRAAQRLDKAGSAEGAGPYHRIRGAGELHRSAGPDVFERDVHAARVRRHHPLRPRHPDDRRSPRRGRHALSGEMPRPVAAVQGGRQDPGVRIPRYGANRATVRRGHSVGGRAGGRCARIPTRPSAVITS